MNAMLRTSARIACLVTLLGAVLFAGTLSPAGAQEKPAAANPADTPAAHLARALTKPTIMQYLDTQLGDIVVDLELRHRIEIFLDTKALLAAGKSAETTFAKSIKDVPFGPALGHLLDDEGLVWFEADGMLHITTPAAARQVERTTVYSPAGLADEGKEPDYDAVADVVEASVFRTKRYHVDRTIRPHHPTRSLVVATNPLEHRDIAKLIGELAEAKQYKGDEKTLPEPSETDAAITRALATPTEVQYLDTKLEDARADLELRMRVFIEFDDWAIAEAANQRGKGPETRINYSVKGVPLGVVLDRMLDPLELTWTRDEVAIVITSKAAESDYSVRRMYRVGDLAAGPEQMTELVDLVRETVAADSWRSEQRLTVKSEPPRTADGAAPAVVVAARPAVGEIAPFSPAGVLVVTQTPRTHRAVAALLDDLRAAKEKP
jgi:hypothetical protein